MEVLEAMPDDVITLIRRHDPAARLRPLPSAEAAAMRDRILRSAVPRPSSRRRRRPLLLAATVATAVLAGAATVYSSIPGDDHAPTVNRQFAAITNTIDLPPGAHWRPLHLPAGALYGQRFALIAAIGQAQCAWYAHWNAAAVSGNDAAVGRSYAEALTLRRMMPLHPTGASEDVGGYDRSSLQATDREIAAAHHGDFTLLREDMRANCGE
jgi:hypothetical protein